MDKGIADKDSNFNNWEGEAFEKLIFDYLDSGYLENIITFFEHEPKYLHLIPKMLSEEKLRLKVGAFAIIEEFKRKNNEFLKTIVPTLVNLLRSSDRNIRGDAVYALEIIADPESKQALVEALEREKDPQVRELIEEALRSMK